MGTALLSLLIANLPTIASATGIGALSALTPGRIKLIVNAIKVFRGLGINYTEEEKKVIKEHNANQSAQRVMYGWR